MCFQKRRSLTNFKGQKLVVGYNVGNIKRAVEISSLFACQLAIVTDVDCVATRNKRTTTTTAHANVTLVAGISTTLFPTYEQSFVLLQVSGEVFNIESQTLPFESN